MKRTLRARKGASARKVVKATAAMGMTVALGTGVAFAAPALTVDVSQGSSTPAITQMDGTALADIVIGAVSTVNDVVNNGIIPQVQQTDYGLTIVFDPHNIPGLAEALAPAVRSQLSTSMVGTTADGRRVVFPTSGQFTSAYGMRWGAMHNGIDVANPIGTPIVAVMDGEVISSGPAQGFGNWIRIRHDDGSMSVYGHMQANHLFVGVGERVSAGQQISAIGNEGRSTGPHLHFEIHPPGSGPVDPQVWFSQQGIYF